MFFVNARLETKWTQWSRAKLGPKEMHTSTSRTRRESEKERTHEEEEDAQSDGEEKEFRFGTLLNSHANNIRLRDSSTQRTLVVFFVCFLFPVANHFSLLQLEFSIDLLFYLLFLKFNFVLECTPCLLLLLFFFFCFFRLTSGCGGSPPSLPVCRVNAAAITGVDRRRRAKDAARFFRYIKHRSLFFSPVPLLFVCVRVCTATRERERRKGGT